MQAPCEPLGEFATHTDPVAHPPPGPAVARQTRDSWPKLGGVTVTAPPFAVQAPGIAVGGASAQEVEDVRAIPPSRSEHAPVIPRVTAGAPPSAAQISPARHVIAADPHDVAAASQAQGAQLAGRKKSVSKVSDWEG